MLKPRPHNPKHLTRHDHRTIIHFDYDCFYASVIESTNPSLKTLPLAIQQKQIIVTCNYEARRRGLHKLQLITEAKRICPDVVIVLGEDLTRFRDASKRLYGFLRGWSWNGKVERLGFDEVWMDVSDVVEWNVDGIREGRSWFQTGKGEPEVGFEFDAGSFAGNVFPKEGVKDVGPESDELSKRLMLGSHLAMHIRHRLEEELGYTSTVGISTNRLVSKLAGNLNKPRGQTTLLPPYEADPTTYRESNVQAFMDDHDIGAVPWVGFKSAQKLRDAVLRRPADFDADLVYGGSKEAVTVDMVRNMDGMSSDVLEKTLAGPGQPKGIGIKVWGLLHGIDDSEVAQAKNVPRQISIEDSYVRLDTMKQLTDELQSLSTRLLERMRVDLTEESEDGDNTRADNMKAMPRTWIGRPHTLRLTTRPRLPIGADGTRPRTFKRISRTAAMPSFVFNLDDNLEALAQRLVFESLIPLFKKLHPGKSGWNLSLVNVAATDMVDTGTDSKAAVGRNIQSMFTKQDSSLRKFQVDDEPVVEKARPEVVYAESRSEAARGRSEISPEVINGDGRDVSPYQTADGKTSVSLFNDDEEVDYDEDEEEDAADEPPGSQEYECTTCGEVIPTFAAKAHERFHLDAG